MNRLLYLLPLVLSISALAQSGPQIPPFQATVNRLFFGCNLTGSASTLLDSLQGNKELTYRPPIGCMSYYSTSTRMGVDSGAMECRHRFTFIKTALPNQKVDSGLIELNIGQAQAARKLLGVTWVLYFSNKKEAYSYFNAIRELFSAVSTQKDVSFDRDLNGYVAKFSARSAEHLDIQDVIFSCAKSGKRGGYEIFLLIPYFMN